MSRYIDADALKLSHCKECSLYPNECMGKDCDWHAIIHINEMPTIDAVPVRHGKWIETDEWDEFSGRLYKCSNCKTFVLGYFDNYCPYCGARMDEK